MVKFHSFLLVPFRYQSIIRFHFLEKLWETLISKRLGMWEKHAWRHRSWNNTKWLTKRHCAFGYKLKVFQTRPGKRHLWRVNFYFPEPLQGELVKVCWKFWTISVKVVTFCCKNAGANGFMQKSPKRSKPEICIPAGIKIWQIWWNLSLGPRDMKGKRRFHNFWKYSSWVTGGRSDQQKHEKIQKHNICVSFWLLLMITYSTS